MLRAKNLIKSVSRISRFYNVPPRPNEGSAEQKVDPIKVDAAKLDAKVDPVNPVEKPGAKPGMMGLIKQYGMIGLGYWLLLYVGGFLLCWLAVSQLGLGSQLMKWEYFASLVRSQTYIAVTDESMDLVVAFILNEILEVARLPLLLMTIRQFSSLFKK